ncbi:CC chemokine-like protein [Fowlpox virus]|nr:CC chemokine-like protein [Fowlpox virus]
MYSVKINTVIIIVLLYLCNYVTCPRPACSKTCCDDGRAYNTRTQNRELCRLKCYLCYLLLTFQNNKVNNSITEFLCNNKTTEDLNKCLLECGESPSRGCEKECCDKRDLVVNSRRKDPDACCDGHKQVDVDDLNEEDIIDCRTSSPKCNNKGFLVLYSNNNTVCVPEGSTSNGEVGHQFGYSDECWKLDEYSSDPKKNYWQDL